MHYVVLIIANCSLDQGLVRKSQKYPLQAQFTWILYMTNVSGDILFKLGRRKSDKLLGLHLDLSEIGKLCYPN